jgi:hypothetical protein
MEDCTSNCELNYILYLPRIFSKTKQPVKVWNLNEVTLPPLVFVVHCLGCTTLDSIDQGSGDFVGIGVGIDHGSGNSAGIKYGRLGSEGIEAAHLTRMASTTASQ